MEECKTIDPSTIKEAADNATKPIVNDDGSHITTIDDMVKLISEKNGGSRQKGGEMTKCTLILATILCSISTVGGIMAFTAACQKYGVTLENLQAAKQSLEGYLVGCDTIEGIAARKLGAPYSLLPTCSDVTSKIEHITVEIAELMKKAPGNIVIAATQGWHVATLLAGGICAGVGICSKKGGFKNKSKNYRKQIRKTKKN
jgi:hypothetical protein